MIRKVTLFLSILITMTHVFADNVSQEKPSNLTNFNYPSHTCGDKIKKPKKVTHVRHFEDIDNYNTAIAEYNINVTNYNNRIKVYKSCINQYIKNGNHDISTIKQKLNNALKEAKKTNH